jgi:hypothetical protein
MLASFLVTFAPGMRSRAQTFTEIQTVAQPPTGSCTSPPFTSVSCSMAIGALPSIMVDGYYTPTDGAGGYFVNNGAGCAPTLPSPLTNGGSIIADGVGTCFVRTSPPTDVRQWGALCDVQPIVGGTVWNYNKGWIEATVPPKTLQPRVGQFITATQIGPGSTTVGGVITTPPVWADRWSKLINKGATYHVGDLIAFKGDPTGGGGHGGKFSQEVSIVVDQVGNNAPTANTLPAGPIYKWHFVSGGQYTTLPLLSGTSPNDFLVQDSSFSCLGPVSAGQCATAGYDTSATLHPAWSGWSVMDSGTSINVAGSGLSVGQQVTFDVAGGTVNQGHYPTILVMSVVGGGSSGPLASWQWLDYGSYLVIPTAYPATPLVERVCTTSCVPCTGPSCPILNPEWTRAALATTILQVYQANDMVHGCPNVLNLVCIVPTDIPQDVQDRQTIEFLYYGDDDGQAINNALKYSSNGQSIHVTGYCGTTSPIVLPINGTAATLSTTSLVGDSYKTAGIFAFAWDLADRGAHPLMNHLVYGPAGQPAFGGGVRDLEIEGMGVPQGSGFYYNSQTQLMTSPGGYTLPTPMCPSIPATPTSPLLYVCTPSSGSVVEVDNAKEAFFTNLAVYDAYGEGNAEFQAGEGDADPTASLGTGFGSLFVNSDRFSVTSNQAGPLDPEFAVNSQAVPDSQYSNLVAADGTESDVYEGPGSIYSGLHVLSDVLNGSHGTAGMPEPLGPPLGWSTVAGPLAGVSLYGLESPRGVIVSNMQCDTVWSACVFVGSASPNVGAPSVVTNIAQKCSGFANVWPTYYAVELAAGITGAAVSNVNAVPSCGIPMTQLVYYDNLLDGARMASQNFSAQYCLPARGFTSNRYYTHLSRRLRRPAQARQSIRTYFMRSLCRSRAA